MDPDFVISEEEGPRSVVSVEYNLLILAEEVVSQIDSGLRPQSGYFPKTLALGQLDGG